MTNVQAEFDHGDLVDVIIRGAKVLRAFNEGELISISHPSNRFMILYRPALNLTIRPHMSIMDVVEAEANRIKAEAKVNVCKVVEYPHTGVESILDDIGNILLNSEAFDDMEDIDKLVRQISATIGKHFISVT